MFRVALLKKPSALWRKYNNRYNYLIHVINHWKAKRTDKRMHE
jgi:hypothetical protein